MHFTRDPIIESVITPREGCKLVVRNSKGVGHEEHFVDAVEVVNFGSTCFFRSCERPKPFLVPCTDYEVLEVRETRVVLRHAAAAEKSIKITGKSDEKPAKNKRASRKKDKEKEKDKSKDKAKDKEKDKAKDKEKEKENAKDTESATDEAIAAPKKERRKRRRRPRDSAKEGSPKEESTPAEQESAPTPQVIPPPKALISESIERYKGMLASENGDNSDEQKGDIAAPASDQE